MGVTRELAGTGLAADDRGSRARGHFHIRAASKDRATAPPWGTVSSHTIVVIRYISLPRCNETFDVAETLAQYAAVVRVLLRTESLAPNRQSSRVAAMVELPDGLFELLTRFQTG